MNGLRAMWATAAALTAPAVIVALVVVVGFSFGLLLRPQAPDAGASAAQPVAAPAVVEVVRTAPAAAPVLGRAAGLPPLGRTPRRAERVHRATAPPRDSSG